MDSSQSFFGHPKGLSTLFFTEMWERFSYYGMRALLLLFMLAALEEGGMELDEQTGGAIYGLYTMFVYLLALPGGWLADNFFGLRKSVFYGGCIIALGHFCMALPLTETFFIGLLLIVLGTGLLKPNISTLVGELYPADQQARRDAGFTLFYAGINSGAALAPLITGYLGEKVNWHYGFGVAGLGMVLGLIQYKLTEKNLGMAGVETQMPS
jgi:POT family proton-dependent oligopeptide transporter